MQNAQSPSVRLIALGAVCICCVAFVGCGAGRDTALPRYNPEMEFGDRQKWDYDESKILESQGVNELLRPAAEGTSNRVVGATELGEFLGTPTIAQTATP